MKILCLLGWHEWTWKLQEGEVIQLYGGVPDRAVCKKCGQKYKI